MYQIFAMSQASEEVARIIGLSAAKDECCQTGGCLEGGLSEVEGVVIKVQSSEGGKLASEE